MWSSDAASIAPVLPGGHDDVGVTVADRADCADERRVRLRPDRLDGVVVHRDRLGRLHEREPVRLERRRAEERRLDLGRRRSSRARDDLVGSAVAPERIDGNADHARSTLYGASRRSGSTSRPLYVLQFGQTRCGRFGCLHVGQTWTRGIEIACCARRLSRLDLDVFRFGTAMSGWAL